MRKVDCEEVRRLIHAFEDDELDAVTSLRVQDHFDGCGTCSRYRSWQRETVRSLGRLREQTPEPDAALRNRVHGIAEKRATAFSVSRRGPFALSAAAALTVLFFLSFLFFPPSGFSGNDARSFVKTHRLAIAAPVEIGIETADPAAAAAWLTERLPGVSAPWQTPEGFQLTGAGIVEIDGKTSGVLFYEKEGSERISCFVFADDKPVSRGFEEVVVRPDGIRAGNCHYHQVVTWSDETGGLVVVGGLSEPSLLAFAETSRR